MIHPQQVGFRLADHVLDGVGSDARTRDKVLSVAVLSVCWTCFVVAGWVLLR